MLSRIFDDGKTKINVVFMPNGSQEAKVLLEPFGKDSGEVCISAVLGTTYSYFSDIGMSESMRGDIKLWCQSCLDNSLTM